MRTIAASFTMLSLEKTVEFRGKLAGFVLIKQGSEITEDYYVWDMAEFFILRRYRRYGGWDRGGPANLESLSRAWEVRVMEAK
jgi:predicted acetyltransferase